MPEKSQPTSRNQRKQAIPNRSEQALRGDRNHTDGGCEPSQDCAAPLHPGNHWGATILGV